MKALVWPVVTEEASSGAADAAASSPNEDVPTAQTLFAISSWPYSARRESANLDASIIEVRPPVQSYQALLHTGCLRSSACGKVLLVLYVASVIPGMVGRC